MKITEEMMRQATSGETPAPMPKNAPAHVPSELEKLKKMNRKDRIWYIFAYYKLHILAALCILILIYVCTTAIYHSTFTDALHCLYVNSRSEEPTNLKPLEEDFAGWLGLGKKEIIRAETAFISYGENATRYSLANMEKITALSMARELDVMVCDVETLEHYSQMDAFLDLEETLPPELASKIQDRLYRAVGSDGRQHAYAIDLGGTPFAEDSALAQDPPLIGIISNSRRTSTAIGLIRYIFQ